MTTANRLWCAMNELHTAPYSASANFLSYYGPEFVCSLLGFEITRYAIYASKLKMC